MRAPAGITLDQVRILLSLPLNASPPAGIDPAAFSPVGSRGVLSPGQSAWAVLDLAPGTYFALCHVPGRATGTPDALLGMLAIFTVGGSATPAA